MLIQSWISLCKFIHTLHNNLCIHDFFYACIKMPSGILASRRDPGETSVHPGPDPTDLRPSRPDPISRPDPNPGGFSRPGSNPSSNKET